MSELPRSDYLAFPFRVGSAGGTLHDRARHVHDRIEQVLFTTPGERVYRPAFGFGVRRLVFAANGSTLRETVRQQLSAALNEALRGDVDPSTLEVDLQGDGHRLVLEVSYRLAALNRQERQRFLLEEDGDG